MEYLKFLLLLIVVQGIFYAMTLVFTPINVLFGIAGYLTVKEWMRS